MVGDETEITTVRETEKLQIVGKKLKTAAEDESAVRRMETPEE